MTTSTALLFEKYFSGIATSEERSEFRTALNTTEGRRLLDEYVEHILAGKEPFADMPAEKAAGVLQSIFETARYVETEQDKKKTKPTLLWLRYAAAAVIIFMAGAGWWLWKQDFGQKKTEAIMVAGIAPGRDGARLKLSDGTIISIDSLKDGLIATDGEITVYKENGRIIYKGNAHSEEKNRMHEIITDRGRQWSAQLPDGSMVWLNAASSLSYPLQFSGKERLVKMTGEAGFRVVHNKQQPFRVLVNGHLVEDIGTEFNINAYDEEPAMLTTLIEGSASVTAGAQKLVLVQGEQAKLNKGATNMQKITGVNIDDVTAWRNGKFRFNGADIKSVMRQIARWYDVEIVYKGNVSDDLFMGGTFRNEQLSEVLKTLELNGDVQFVIEGRKIIVKQ